LSHEDYSEFDEELMASNWGGTIGCELERSCQRSIFAEQEEIEVVEEEASELPKLAIEEREIEEVKIWPGDWEYWEQ
jgi:hypothetical protein